MIEYALYVGLALFSIGIAGIISSRHFILLVVSGEISLLGGIVTLVSFLQFASTNDGSAFSALLSIWSIAALEVIVVVLVYEFMRKKVPDFDISKLSKLKG